MKGYDMTALRLLATAVMTAGFGFFGIAKITTASVVTESNSWDRLAEWQWAAIGTLEVLAVVSLLAALHPKARSLGVAAAAGLATLTACAVVFHISNGDPFGDIAPAIIQGLVAVTYVAVARRGLTLPLASSEPARSASVRTS